ncbi:MAG: STAS domain-containing protein [Chloroflexota bacterium]|nr:MAG: STAS domain-containing protein [Chloroflexota bacterium]
MSHRRAIGLITRYISGRFFEHLMSGVQSVARQHQVDILVIQGTPENVASTQIAKQRVDGWLVLTYTQGLDLLAQQGKPIVTISCRVPDQPFPAVFPDNRQGMESIMEHLLAKGHRRIAFAGDTSIGDIQERYVTYQSVLEQHNIPFDPDLVIITDNPLADRGALAARELLERKASYTAIAAGNDWAAIGLMRELQGNGIRIPDDIAIVGFDDIPEAQTTNPPLSTVRQRTDELGSTAARLLVSQMAGQPVAPEMYYIPTTFVARESSGDNLIARMSQWTQPKIVPGSLWKASLSRELVRVLLPALPLDPPPSPAQVWPEVDKLVQLFAKTIENPAIQSLDPHLLNAVLSSPPILNANPEILVELMRVLESVGVNLIAGQPESAQARQRLYALLDQLHIEMMRSYRRRQTGSQRTLQEVLQSQYNISQLLQQCPPEQIDWLKETPMYSGCLGLWAPSGGNQPPNIGIAGWYQRDGSSSLRAGMSYTAPQFPPIDLLPSVAQPNDITTCLVLNIQTADHDWGMLAVSGPLISYDPWLEDNTINTLEICCGFLGIALEREALQESLRRSSEYEQFLADHIRKLTYPVIALKDGVLLVPLASMLESDQSQQIISETINEIIKQPVADIFLDLRGLSILDTMLEQTLIEIARMVTQRGARVTLIGARPDVQQRMIDQNNGLSAISNQPSIVLALEHLNLR